jgi:hypothetical protein
MEKIMSQSVTHSKVFVKTAVIEVIVYLLICHVKTFTNQSYILFEERLHI